MRRTRAVSAACSMWWMLKCDSDSAQINNKQKNSKMMETNYGEHWPADTQLAPPSSAELDSTRLSSFDLVQPHSAYSNELWIATPKMHPFCQFSAHHHQSHIADALSARRKNIYRLKVERITAIKYEKTFGPMAALLCVGRSIHTCIICGVCVHSNQQHYSILLQFFLFSFHFVWLFPIATKYSFHPNHYYSTPIHFFTSPSPPLYAHNRFQFHHWNLLQYSIQPCKRYFFFDSLSHTFCTPLALHHHSPFNLIGESESNFFLKKRLLYNV